MWIWIVVVLIFVIFGFWRYKQKRTNVNAHIEELRLSAEAAKIKKQAIISKKTAIAPIKNEKENKPPITERLANARTMENTQPRPRIEDIANAAHAEQLSKKELPITGVSDETKEKIKQELVASAMKGENPRHAADRMKDVEDFDWPEFDKWREIFLIAGEWPPLWDEVGEYTCIQHYSVEDLLKELKKEQLKQLADEYGLVTKRAKNEILREQLTQIIPVEDEEKILAIVNEKWRGKFLKAKRFLLAQTMSFAYDVTEIKSKYDVCEYIEISGTPDSCRWCQKKNKKIKLATLKQEDLPPHHPGCRCCVVPVTD